MWRVSLVQIATMDGRSSIAGNVVCQVERSGVVIVVDIHLVEVGEVCWLINNDVWGMRIQ